MAALAKKNQWKLALELMEEMAEAGVEPDIISYNTAMHVCGKAGKWQTVRRRLDSTRLTCDLPLLLMDMRPSLSLSTTHRPTEPSAIPCSSPSPHERRPRSC